MTQVTDQVKSSTMIMFEEEVVERRLNFKPDPEINNLCLGYLDEVRVEFRESPRILEDGTENTWEYAGLKVPSLILTFKQARSNTNPKDRYYTHVFKPVTTVTKDGSAVELKTVVNILQQEYARLRHIANQYKGLKNYPVDLGSCPGIDPAASPSTRCEQYAAFFKYFQTLLTGVNADAPMYKGVKLWIKLIADFSTRKFLTFPTYVGRGFVERVVEGMAPTIDFEPNETVQLAKGAEKKGNHETAATAPASVGDTAPSAEIQSILDKYR